MKFPAVVIKESRWHQDHGYECNTIYAQVDFEYKLWCYSENRPFKEHLNLDEEYYLKARKHIMELEL